MHVLEKFRLNGQTALVTGCRRGIGKAMALALAEAGADIIGVSKSMEKESSQIEQDVRALNRNFKGYACDFGDRKALYAFIELFPRFTRGAYSGPPTRTHKWAMASWPSRLARSTRTM
jgi:NAD(P)-dependent dehydrogenase (short-subunit alcohol dehydrogenase family)